jgi:hypothetical protein
MSVSSILNKTTGKIASQYLPTYTPTGDGVRLYSTKGSITPISTILTGEPQIIGVTSTLNEIIIPDESYSYLKSTFTINFVSVKIDFTEEGGVPATPPPDYLRVQGLIDNATVIGSEYLYMGVSGRYAQADLKLIDENNFLYSGIMTYSDVMAYSSENLTEQDLLLSFIAPYYKTKVDENGTLEPFTATIASDVENTTIQYYITWEPCNFIAQ